MTDTFTTADLIAELQQYHRTYVPRRTTEKGEKCGVTILEWSEERGVSDTAARNQLRKFIAKGILERVWTLDGGDRMYVYYRIESK